MYALIKNGEVIQFPYAVAQLKRDNPQTSFPKNLTPELLATFNVFLVKPTEQPAYDPLTQRVEEGTPVNEAGEWVQAWSVVPLSTEELEARVPRSVTMRQGRLALLQAGYLAQVDAAIQAIEDPIQKAAAEIEWEYAQTIDRDSTFTQTLAAQLGLTNSELRDLFTLASTL